ncbi:MAG: hypothetical protein MJ229_01275 [bacterium]|nr:hypothetical protein [bacterium]
MSYFQRLLLVCLNMIAEISKNIVFAQSIGISFIAFANDNISNVSIISENMIIGIYKKPSTLPFFESVLVIKYELKNTNIKEIANSSILFPKLIFHQVG